MTNSERQTSIDAVRGFAVLGILIMNIVGMGLPLFAYVDPNYAGGADGANLWTWAVNFVVFDGKMRGLFTMLFGASMVLIADRSEGEKPGPNTIHYRRMFWLLWFGLLHAVLFWTGDILVCYAIAGSVAFLARRWKPAVLIGVGFGILAALFGLMVFTAFMTDAARDAAMAPGASPEAIAKWEEEGFLVFPPLELGEQQTAGMLGGFLDAMEARVNVLIILYTVLLPVELIEAVGQMLIGIGLYRLGFFSLKWKTGQYFAVIAVGYLIAAPVSAWLVSRVLASGFDPVERNFADAFGSGPRPFIALAHASVLLLVVRSGAVPWLVNRLAAAGRMALSNYLMSSIITTVIFCGFGFGLFGKLERAELWWVVLGVWAFILIWSRPWLQRFEYGPFEWLWRSLVRWRPQPFVKPVARPAEAA